MIRRKSNDFVWDHLKEEQNVLKHGIDFKTAALAFKDPKRIIAIDDKHSTVEERYFCIGKINKRIATVRFVFRDGQIRIIGAGYWRKGVMFYEKENN